MYGVFLSLLFAVAVTNGANDWSIPCHSGQCAYDHNASGSNSSIMLSGAMTAISDLTEAGGWKILNCNPNTMDQDIRIVCMSQTSGICAHLYQNGAADTLVRLPQDCGQMPFARFVSEWTHENQSVPESVSSVMRRRDGSLPVVKGMKLDTNFSAINLSMHGPVSMYIMASSAPPVLSNKPRGFSFSHSTDLPAVPIDITSPFTVLHTSVNCGSTTASVDINALPDINITLSFNAVINGTIVPPNVNDMNIVTGLDGELLATLDVMAVTSATVLDTGKIVLYQIGLPGLSVPGIYDIGPSLQLTTQATASIGASLDFKVDIAYQISNSTIIFPHTSESVLNINALPTNLNISSDPTVSYTGTLQAHLTPTINFGITALSVINANVYADVDGVATLLLTVQPSPNTTNTFQGNVNVTAGFTVNVGADNTFFGLWKVGVVDTLFARTWSLFNKSFGIPSFKRSHSRVFRSSRRLLKKRGNNAPTCSANFPLGVVPVVNSVVTGI